MRKARHTSDEMVKLVILECESSEPLTGGSDKTVDCAERNQRFP